MLSYAAEKDKEACCLFRHRLRIFRLPRISNEPAPSFARLRPALWGAF